MTKAELEQLMQKIASIHGQKPSERLALLGEIREELEQLRNNKCLK